jgi:chromosome partitioning protein
MPSRQKDEPGYEYWNQIKIGLEPLRDRYDAIVVDTNPSLGFLTQNAMIVADMIFSPCPQEALDYASLVQFWGVFADLASRIPNFSQSKEYDCVEVFITKAQSVNDELATAINGWIRGSFGNNLCDISIPESTAPQKASSELKTVYESMGKETSLSSYRRYKDPLDRFVNHIDAQLTLAWRR